MAHALLKCPPRPMTGQAYLRCKKMAYDSRQMAKNVERLKIRGAASELEGTGRTLKGVKAYICPMCGNWHVGHS
jgi:hypothetical protein